MNQVLYKYYYSGLFRHRKGLGFLITSPVSVEEKANGIVRNNDIENPELLVGSYVYLDAFTGYNGRETFHKKLFPFANFKVVDVVNYGNGTFAVIVDYPAVAAGAAMAMADTTLDISEQFNTELFVQFDNPMSGFYLEEASSEGNASTSTENLTGSGCFRVSAKTFDVPDDGVTSNLISVPDGYKTSSKGTEVTPYKKMQPGGFSLKQLALVVLVIVVLIAIFKYIVK